MLPGHSFSDVSIGCNMVAEVSLTRHVGITTNKELNKIRNKTTNFQKGLLVPNLERVAANNLTGLLVPSPCGPTYRVAKLLRPKRAFIN